MRLIRLIALLLFIAHVPAIATAADKEPAAALNVAIVGDDRQLTGEQIDLVAVAVSKISGITLVGREQAEAILHVGLETRAETTRYRLRLIEIRTGVRLMDWLATPDQFQPDQPELFELLEKRLHTLRTPDPQRYYVSMIGMRSEEACVGRQIEVKEDLLRRMGTILTPSLQQDLQRLPGTIVLERELLHLVQAESKRSGIELDLTAPTYVLEVGLRRCKPENNIQVTLKANAISGEKNLVRTLSLPPDDLSHIRRAVVDTFAEMLATPAAAGPGMDRKKEAELLAKRFLVMQESLPLAHVLPLAEAAYVLDPSHRNFQIATYKLPFGGDHDGDYRLWLRRHQIQFDFLQRCLKSEELTNEVILSDPDSDALCVFFGFPSAGSGGNYSRQERSEIVDEVKQLEMAKYDLVVNARRKHGKSSVGLHNQYLHWCRYFPDGRMERIKSIVDEVEQDCKAGRLNRSLNDSLYSFFFVVLKQVAGQQHWLREWLTTRDDPVYRLAGYTAQLREDKETGLETAEKALDIALFKLPVAGTLADRPAAGTIYDAARKLQRAGQLIDYLKKVSQRIEESDDSLILYRWKYDFARIIRKEEDSEDAGYYAFLLDSSRPKAQVPDPENSPWKNYDLRLCKFKCLDRYHTYPRAIYLDRTSQAEQRDEQLLLLYPVAPQPSRANRLPEPHFALVAASLYNGTVREIARLPEFGSGQVPWVHGGEYGIAAMGDRYFVSIRTSGIWMITDGGSEFLTLEDGLPGLHVETMAVMNNELYLSLKGVLAKFDPRTKKFTIIASRLSVSDQNTLDGEPFLVFQSMVPDEPHQCLWLSAYPVLNIVARERTPPIDHMTGIWKYSPDSNSIQTILRGSPSSLRLCEDSVCFSSKATASPERHRIGEIQRANGQVKWLDQFGRFGSNTRETVDTAWLHIGKHLFDNLGAYTADQKRYGSSSTAYGDFLFEYFDNGIVYGSRYHVWHARLKNAASSSIAPKKSPVALAIDDGEAQLWSREKPRKENPPEEILPDGLHPVADGCFCTSNNSKRPPVPSVIQISIDPQNEFRGFIEYDLSNVPPHFESAQMILSSRRSTGPYPVDLDVYAYKADGILTTDDWDLGKRVATVPYSRERTFSIDVTSALRTAVQSGDRYLGFGVRLARPSHGAYVVFGARQKNVPPVLKIEPEKQAAKGRPNGKCTGKKIRLMRRGRFYRRIRSRK
jgi:hypothetical protein